MVVVVVIVVGWVSLWWSLLCSGSKKNTMQLLEYGNCSRWCLSLSLSLSLSLLLLLDADDRVAAQQQRRCVWCHRQNVSGVEESIMHTLFRV